MDISIQLPPTKVDYKEKRWILSYGCLHTIVWLWPLHNGLGPVEDDHGRTFISCWTWHEAQVLPNGRSSFLLYLIMQIHNPFLTKITQRNSHNYFMERTSCWLFMPSWATIYCVEAIVLPNEAWIGEEPRRGKPEGSWGNRNLEAMWTEYSMNWKWDEY